MDTKAKAGAGPPRRATAGRLATGATAPAQLAWLLALALWGPPAARASAAEPAAQSPMAGEFAGGRAQAMGHAHRGVGQNNDTIIFNPAGMALLPRYSVEMQYGYQGAGHLNSVTGSIVDSKSSQLAAGLRATRVWGNPSGLDVGVYQLAASSAWALGDRLAVGVTGKNHRGHWRPEPQSEAQDISLWTGTLGLMARPLDRLSVGVTWENLLQGDDAHRLMLRPAVAGGGGLQLGRLSVAADGRIDLRPGASRTPDLAIGLEANFLSALACRVGYYTDQALVGQPRRQALTGGLGVQSATAAFQLGLERGLGPTAVWGIFTSMQLSV